MLSALVTGRRLAPVLGPVLGLALVLSAAVVALHHHGADEAGHSCVVCAAGHAPAVETATDAGASAPRTPPARLDSPRAVLPAPAQVAAPTSRGPPIL